MMWSNLTVVSSDPPAKDYDGLARQPPRERGTGSVASARENECTVATKVATR